MYVFKKIKICNFDMLTTIASKSNVNFFPLKTLSMAMTPVLSMTMLKQYQSKTNDKLYIHKILNKN